MLWATAEGAGLPHILQMKLEACLGQNCTDGKSDFLGSFCWGGLAAGQKSQVFIKINKTYVELSLLRSTGPKLKHQLPPHPSLVVCAFHLSRLQESVPIILINQDWVPSGGNQSPIAHERRSAPYDPIPVDWQDGAGCIRKGTREEEPCTAEVERQLH